MSILPLWVKRNSSKEGYSSPLESEYSIFLNGPFGFPNMEKEKSFNEMKQGGILLSPLSWKVNIQYTKEGYSFPLEGESS